MNKFGDNVVSSLQNSPYIHNKGEEITNEALSICRTWIGYFAYWWSKLEKEFNTTTSNCRKLLYSTSVRHRSTEALPVTTQRVLC